MQKVMWARVIVMAPTPRGQPMSCPIATNSSNSDRPVMTSGMTIGAVVMPASSSRPRKGPKRANAMPASVPSTTAALAEISAMRIESQAAPRICSLLASVRYHLKVGECAASHTVTRRELLKENTIIDTIGTYRNTSPSTSMLRANSRRGLTRRSQLASLEALEQDDRHDQQQQCQDRHRARHRPVAILEELIRQHPADHQLIGAPEERRDYVLAHRRDEH